MIVALVIAAIGTGLVIALLVVGVILVGGLGAFVRRRRRRGGVIASRRRR